MPNQSTKSKTENVKNSIRTVTSECRLSNDVCSVSETIVEQLQQDSKVMRSHHPVEIAVAIINVAREQCTQKEPINVGDVAELNALNTGSELNSDSNRGVSTLTQLICDELNITPVKTTPKQQLESVREQFGGVVPSNVVDEAEQILSDIGSETVRGMHPRTVTAAALYAACLTTRTPVSQETIGDVMNVSETSIQGNYRDVLNAYSQHSIPEETVLDAHHFKLLKAIEQEYSC